MAYFVFQVRRFRNIFDNKAKTTVPKKFAQSLFEIWKISETLVICD